ncbi:MAG TPA: hypothetical protein VIT38_10475 [Allosphingosinicella sp.]|jgi:hypothetical protein
MRFWPLGAAGLYLLLFLFFFVLGGLLMLLGFDLGEVDLWIDAQGGWLDAVGSFLFRAFCGLVMLLCAFMVLGFLYDRIFGRRNRDLTAAPARESNHTESELEAARPPGLGCAILALIVGYFAWFGMVYP